MAKRWWKTLISMITFCITRSHGSTNKVDIITSTIQSITAPETRNPDCVFFDLGSKNRDAFDNILQSPKLNFIPKYVINRDIDINYGSIPRKPIILLIRARNMTYSDNSIIQILQHFNQNTQLIVLVNKDSKNFKIVETYVRMLAFHNVIYLDLSSSSLGVTGLNAKGMIEDSMRRNFTGSPLTFTKRQIGPDPFDPTFKWIQETAFYLNTTAVQSMHFCALSESDLQDDCYFDHFQTNKVDIDCTTYSLLSTSEYEFRFDLLISNVPSVKVIVVPRLQRNVVELFLLPFDREVWFVLLIFLTAIEVISFLKPTFFLNDPILLSVCGFERCSLYRASRWEKMVLMSLVLWMFFMTCAYETKFLSMLVYKPVEPKINTIQDLLKSSINLKANLLMSPDIEMETQLEGVVINSNDSEFEMDNTHAYIFEKMYIEPSLPYYYDTKTKTARYYKMDETLGSFVKGYVLSDRNPLLDLFGYTHVVFVESGIWNVWNSKYITSQGQFCHSTTDEILSFWDLVPAWAAFAFGCVMSGLVFVYEIVTLKCFHNRFRYVITSVLQ
ncbi:uncharacterized protein LOC120416985 [Culex pipiens pallens]|uniref:uncharacterized protein LOC120416985 n=1 Tax=Culex pipiens pallens TaxID=42434 RepID=UPI001952F6CB|nr:uncharacterized protein LOC120416985 [Culex pipiens pallens]